MPVNGFNSGIDHKITFTDVTGVQYFATLESFTAKEDATSDKIISMNGVVDHAKFHGGWSGSFVIQRKSDVMDNYIAAQELGYYQGVNQSPLTITETITEVNGSVTQWQYTKVVIILEDNGNWSGTEIVKQRVTFQASTRIQLT